MLSIILGTAYDLDVCFEMLKGTSQICFVGWYCVPILAYSYENKR